MCSQRECDSRWRDARPEASAKARQRAKLVTSSPVFQWKGRGCASGSIHIGPNKEGTNVEGDQSPATSLAHEFGHAWLAQASPKLNAGFEKADANDAFSTNEHKWVLKNVETPFAKTRGEGQRAEYKSLFSSKEDYQKKSTSGYGSYFFKWNKNN